MGEVSDGAMPGKGLHPPASNVVPGWVMHVPVNSFIDPVQVLVLLNLVNQFEDSFILTFTGS